MCLVPCALCRVPCAVCHVPCEHAFARVHLQWDTNGDGTIDRKEFHKALPLLGFDAPKKEIDALFDSWWA